MTKECCVKFFILDTKHCLDILSFIISRSSLHIHIILNFKNHTIQFISMITIQILTLANNHMFQRNYLICTIWSGHSWLSWSYYRDVKMANPILAFSPISFCFPGVRTKILIMMQHYLSHIIKILSCILDIFVEKSSSS